jgi:hypothetical protein
MALTVPTPSFWKAATNSADAAAFISGDWAAELIQPALICSDRWDPPLRRSRSAWATRRQVSGSGAALVGTDRDVVEVDASEAPTVEPGAERAVLAPTASVVDDLAAEVSDAPQPVASTRAAKATVAALVCHTLPGSRPVGFIGGTISVLAAAPRTMRGALNRRPPSPTAAVRPRLIGWRVRIRQYIPDHRRVFVTIAPPPEQGGMPATSEDIAALLPVPRPAEDVRGALARRPAVAANNPSERSVRG